MKKKKKLHPNAQLIEVTATGRYNEHGYTHGRLPLINAGTRLHMLEDTGDVYVCRLTPGFNVDIEHENGALV